MQSEKQYRGDNSNFLHWLLSVIEKYNWQLNHLKLHNADVSIQWVLVLKQIILNSKTVKLFLYYETNHFKKVYNSIHQTVEKKCNRLK